MGAKKGKEQVLGKGKEGPFQRRAYGCWGQQMNRESAFFPSSRFPKQIPVCNRLFLASKTGLL